MPFTTTQPLRPSAIALTNKIDILSRHLLRKLASDKRVPLPRLRALLIRSGVPTRELFTSAKTLHATKYSLLFTNDKHTRKRCGGDYYTDYYAKYNSPWAVLGLADESASQPAIKKAYRKMALKYHPDKQRGKSDDAKRDAEERMKAINEAFVILQSPMETRAFKNARANRTAEHGQRRTYTNRAHHSRPAYSQPPQSQRRPQTSQAPPPHHQRTPRNPTYTRAETEAIQRFSARLIIKLLSVLATCAMYAIRYMFYSYPLNFVVEVPASAKTPFKGIVYIPDATQRAKLPLVAGKSYYGKVNEWVNDDNMWNGPRYKIETLPVGAKSGDLLFVSRTKGVYGFLTRHEVHKHSFWNPRTKSRAREDVCVEYTAVDTPDDDAKDEDDAKKPSLTKKAKDVTTSATTKAVGGASMVALWRAMRQTIAQLLQSPRIVRRLCTPRVYLACAVYVLWYAPPPQTTFEGWLRRRVAHSSYVKDVHRLLTTPTDTLRESDNVYTEWQRVPRPVKHGFDRLHTWKGQYPKTRAELYTLVAGEAHVPPRALFRHDGSVRGVGEVGLALLRTASVGGGGGGGGLV